MRERNLAILLALAAVLVAIGIAHYSTGGAFIAGGVLLALWSWLIFGEV